VLSLNGTGIGRDIAIGRAIVLKHWHGDIPRYPLAEDAIDDEVSRFQQAVASARAELKRVQQEIPEDAPPETGAFIDVHLLMLDDPVIALQPIESIRQQHQNAEWCLKTHADTLIAFFDSIEEPYLRSKKNDVGQVVERILDALMVDDTTHPHGLRALEENLDGQVIVGHDLTPADTVMLRHRGMAGFVTRLGGPISHTAILARSLGVPAVVGLHNAINYIRNDDVLIIDTTTGTVLVAPDDALLCEFREQRQQQREQQQQLALLRSETAVTRDGHEATLLANIELPEDLDALGPAGAQGVGLYRTEFLFMNRKQTPTEAEQYDAYCHVLRTVDGPVTIRTLDLGADKQVDGGRTDSQANMTPALGLRAIRLCLHEPALFKPQLRAILRAAVHGDARIMIPMLSNLHELEQTLELVREVCRELELEGADFKPNIPVGGMIEVPAAAVAADLFARKLDFLSIGTNDLIQYTLAIDRIDDTVNYLYDPLHPSVLRLIYRVIEAGHDAGIPVSMCGEMASDPEFTRLLLGLGLRQFSMEPSSLLKIKQRIRQTELEPLQSVVRDILDCGEPTTLHSLVDLLNQAQAS